MGKIIDFLIGKIGIGIILRGIYIGLISIYYLAVMAIFSSFVIAFFYFYDLVQQFLTLITSGGSFGANEIISKVFGALNCLGIIPALNDSKSIVAAGLLFLFGRIASLNVVKVYRELILLITPLLK